MWLSLVLNPKTEKIPIYNTEPSDSQTQMKLKEFSLTKERKNEKMGPLSIAQLVLWMSEMMDGEEIHKVQSMIPSCWALPSTAHKNTKWSGPSAGMAWTKVDEIQ